MKKEMKKLISMALVLLMVFMFAGCGGDKNDYPTMGEAELGSNMETAEGNDFKAQYDADKWVYDDTLNFGIFDKEVYEKGGEDEKCSNVNVIVGQEYKGTFTEDDMKSIVEESKNLGVPGYSIELNELRSFQDETVIYFESKMELSDEALDLMIESGQFTEELIEQLGGREFIIEQAGVTTQCSIVAIIDDHVVTFTGSYASDEEKAAVTNAILVMIQTGEVTA